MFMTCHAKLLAGSKVRCVLALRLLFVWVWSEGGVSVEKPTIRAKLLLFRTILCKAV